MALQLIPLLFAVIEAAIPAGDIQAAESAASEASELAAANEGNDPLLPLQLRAKLGEVLEARGHYRSSEETLSQVLEDHAEIHGQEHPQAIRAALALSSVRLRRGLSSGAELARSTGQALRAELGGEHPLTLRSEIIVSGFLGLKNRHPEALSLCESARATARTLYGVDSAVALEAERTLVSLYTGARRFEAGRFLANEVINRHRSVFGDGHRFTLASERLLGDLLLNQGRWSEAEEVYENILDVQLQVLGDDHADTLLVLTRLADVCWNKTRHVDEARLLERVLAVDDAVEKLPPVEIGTAHYRLGVWLRRQFFHERAMSELDTGLSRATVELAPDAPIVKSLRAELDSVEKQYQNSLKSLATRTSALEEVLETDGPATKEVEARIAYAGSLARAGRHAEAETEIRDVISRIPEVKGLHPANLTNATVTLAYVLWFQRRFEEADKSILSAIEPIDRSPVVGALGRERFIALSQLAGRMRELDERISVFYEWNDEVENRIRKLKGRKEPRIRRNSRWRYLDDGRDLGTAWREPGYDHSSWPEAPGPFGFGTWNIGTVCGQSEARDGKPTTVYFRREFRGLENTRGIVVRLRRDDGAAVYINGVEVIRDRLKPDAVFQDVASKPVKEVAGRLEGFWYYSFLIPPGTVREGSNIIAVEVHQDNEKDDLAFDLVLETWRGG